MFVSSKFGIPQAFCLSVVHTITLFVKDIKRLNVQIISGISARFLVHNASQKNSPPKGLYPIVTYPKRSAPNISAFILRCAIRKAPP